VPDALAPAPPLAFRSTTPQGGWEQALLDLPEGEGAPGFALNPGSLNIAAALAVPLVVQRAANKARPLAPPPRLSPPAAVIQPLAHSPQAFPPLANRRDLVKNRSLAKTPLGRGLVKSRGPGKAPGKWPGMWQTGIRVYSPGRIKSSPCISLQAAGGPCLAHGSPGPGPMGPPWRLVSDLDAHAPELPEPEADKPVLKAEANKLLAAGCRAQSAELPRTSTSTSTSPGRRRRPRRAGAPAYKLII
jgi:hypothetical protein